MLVTLCAIGLILAVIFFRGTIADRFRGSGSEASGPFRPPATQCDPSYSGACIPSPPPDITCQQLEELGISEVRLTGSDDPQDLDSDGDGIGCNED